MAIRCEAACTYCATSTRDTTPEVTEVLSPPVGYLGVCVCGGGGAPVGELGGGAGEEGGGGGAPVG